MAKLSTMTPRSRVAIPIGGQTCSAIWLEYNHYGKNEVSLLLHDYYSVNAIAPGYSKKHPFFGSYYDNVCVGEIPYMMAENLRKSLVPVTISDLDSTAKRSIFLPSVKEVGCRSSITYNLFSGYINYLSDGYSTEISTLSSIIDTYNKDYNIVMRGRVVSSSTNTGTTPTKLTRLVQGYDYTNVYELTVDSWLPIYPGNTGSVPTMYGAAPGESAYYSDNGVIENSIEFAELDQRLPSRTVESPIANPSGTVAYGPVAPMVLPIVQNFYRGNAGAYLGRFTLSYIVSGGTSNTRTMEEVIVSNPSLMPPLIMCLDGNCEVTGVGSDWTLSKAAAVETYRKINGVWYRTT